MRSPSSRFSRSRPALEAEAEDVDSSAALAALGSCDVSRHTSLATPGSEDMLHYGFGVFGNDRCTPASSRVGLAGLFDAQRSLAPLRERVRLGVLGRAWRSWRQAAVESAQKFRRDQRHARAVRVARLLHAWHAATAREVAMHAESTSLLRQRQIDRFVHQQMQRLRAAAEVQRRISQHIASCLSFVVCGWHRACVLDTISHRNNAFLVQAVFQLFAEQLRSEAYFRCVTERRAIESLRLFFQAFVTHVQLAIVLRDKQLFLAQRVASLRRGRNIQYLRLRSHEQTAQKVCRALVVEAMVLQRKRRCLCVLRSHVVMSERVRAFATHRHVRSKSSMFATFRAAVTRSDRALLVYNSCRASLGRLSLRRWGLVVAVRGRFKALRPAQAFETLCLFSLWMQDCMVPVMVREWRAAALQLQFVSRANTQLLGLIVSMWVYVLKRPRALQQHLDWRDSSRVATTALLMWARHTRLEKMGHVLSMLQLRGWTLVLLRCWRFGSVVQRAEDLLQTQVFQAWSCYVVTARQAREEMLDNRLADEVAETLSLRRLLRFLVDGVAAWGDRARVVRRVRLDIASSEQSRLVRKAFYGLRWQQVIARLAGIAARLDERVAAFALSRLHLSCRAAAVADFIKFKRQERTWSAIRVLFLVRGGYRDLSELLVRIYYGAAFSQLRDFALRLLATESKVFEARRRRTLAIAFMKLQRCCLNSIQVTDLLPLLHAWSKVATLQRGHRARDYKRVFTALRANGREHWAFRRRLAIADNLSVRRRMRAAILPWRLLSFGGDSSRDFAELLSEAAAGPRAVRPLVVLHSGL